MTASDTNRLIIALDRPSRAEAEDLIARIGPGVSFYKVGLELLFSDGLGLAKQLKRDGKSVFLDLKFLDIANTVEQAVAKASELDFDCLTVHGHDSKTMQAAVRGRDAAGTQTKLLAVTVLTSLNADDLREQTNAKSPAELVLHRAQLARDCGFDGVIASGKEAGEIRAHTGSDFLIVTPGIRLPTDDAGDQARITTPADAIKAGASHLVVGRPITNAEDPSKAAEKFNRAILEQLAASG
ncbi:MAG: orotidine-5'-phosphate decarboxylase [Pseudomonadota bacterium]